MPRQGPQVEDQLHDPIGHYPQEGIRGDVFPHERQNAVAVENPPFVKVLDVQPIVIECGVGDRAFDGKFLFRFRPPFARQSIRQHLIRHERQFVVFATKIDDVDVGFLALFSRCRDRSRDGNPHGNVDHSPHEIASDCHCNLLHIPPAVTHVPNTYSRAMIAFARSGFRPCRGRFALSRGNRWAGDR